MRVPRRGGGGDSGGHGFSPACGQMSSVVLERRCLRGGDLDGARGALAAGGEGGGGGGVAAAGAAAVVLVRLVRRRVLLVRSGCRPSIGRSGRCSRAAVPCGGLWHGPRARGVGVA